MIKAGEVRRRQDPLTPRKDGSPVILQYDSLADEFVRVKQKIGFC